MKRYINGGVILERLTFNQKWVSYLSAVQSCLAYQKVEISDGWLYGGTGLAFAINTNASGGGAIGWNWLCSTCDPEHPGMVLKLAPNVGFQPRVIERCPQNKTEFKPEDARAMAWALVRESLDNGIPCLGFHLDFTEFAIIYGYDKVGYYYSGPASLEGAGPKPWQELGADNVGWIHAESIAPCKPASDETVVRDAINAVQDRESPPYTAYDLWAEKLENGTLDPFGRCHDPAYWAECRTNAVDFLKEAKVCIDKADALFDEAIDHYSIVAEKLTIVSNRNPFTDEEVKKGSIADTESAELLREAGKSEKKGFDILRKIASAIS
jgi:hypothetical protein